MDDNEEIQTIPGFTENEARRILRIASDHELNIDDTRDWFSSKKRERPDRSFLEIENEFLRGPGARISLRNLAKQWGVSPQSVSSFLVKWRARPENKNRSQLEGLRAYAGKRMRGEVIKAREEGRPGSEKMSIIKSLPPGFIRKMTLHGEIVEDITDLALRYRSSGIPPRESIDHAIHTVAILRSTSIAESIMDAITSGIDQFEVYLRDGGYTGLSSPLRVSKSIYDFASGEIHKSIESYGLDTIMSVDSLGELRSEIRRILRLSLSNKIDRSFNPTDLLDAAVLRGLLNTNTIKTIYYKLPYSLRQPIEGERNDQVHRVGVKKGRQR